MVKEQKLEQQNINQEQVKPTEQSAEKSLDSTKIEQNPQEQEEKINNNQMAAQVAIPEDQAQQPISTTSEIIHKEVDAVLSEGMDNIFLSLDAGTQREFKIKGEEISHKITVLLVETKIKIGEITRLIMEWLRIIPKVNKHYLEQEAKIKTEKLLKINQSK